MDKFPVDAPKQKVIATLKKLGFRVVRDKEHISMLAIMQMGQRHH
jgi:hypothetical protein